MKQKKEKPEGKKPEEMVKEFKKCPICGSKRCFSDEAVKGETLPSDMKDKINIILSAELIIPTIVPTKLQALCDVCWDCGTLYARALFKFKKPPVIPGGDGGKPRIILPGG